MWRVTVGVAAPDCFERPVLLVNGQLHPTLEVTQGSILEVRIWGVRDPAGLLGCLASC